MKDLIGGETMISQEEYMEIQILRKQGYRKKEIARALGISKNTVKKYLHEEESSHEKGAPPKYKGRAPQSSKLDPFKEYVVARLEKGLPHRIPATVIYREIVPMGYHGRETILRSFIHKYWERRKTTEPSIRFETHPAEQMQVDWTTVHLGKRRLSVFLAILGFSRKSYLEFTTNQQEETLLRCHENAFHYFDGVPLNVLYDNMKTVVSHRDCFGKSKHQYQKTLYDFAKHYGFRPGLCRPYRPQTKGKVERFVSYFKHSFYYPLITKECFDDSISGLNFELHKWLKQFAENRFIKELGATPSYLYKEEKEHLQPLPKTPYGFFLPECEKPVTDMLWTPNLKIYEEIGGKYEYTT